MPSNSSYACIPCRIANKTGGNCMRCGTPMTYAGKRWRAPKKNNVRAWKRVKAGDWLWELPLHIPRFKHGLKLVKGHRTRNI